MISVAQLDSVNVTCVKLDRCEEVSDTLKAQNKRYHEAVADADRIMKAQFDQNILNDRIKAEQRNQINGWIEKDKKNTKKITWLKVQRNTLLIAVLAAAVKIFVLH